MSRYLRNIRVERYGGLADREVGPFGAGLNVVFGANEAGKSTLASLVGGVLFGWEDAHGVRNTYHPAEGGRAGWLTWANAEESVSGTSGTSVAPGAGNTLGAGSAPGISGALGASGVPGSGSAPGASGVPGSGSAPGTSGEPGASAAPDASGAPSASLARNEDGVTGDLSVVDDIDRATYDAIFALTADELRSLRNSSDVTARLLTAGSGTASSPSAAFVEIERRIASTPVYQLESELEAAQERVRTAGEQVKLFMQEDRELRELQTSRAAIAARLVVLDSEVESLVAWRVELEAAEARAAQLESELADLHAEREALSEALTSAIPAAVPTSAAFTAISNQSAPAVALASGAPAAALASAAPVATPNQAALAPAPTSAASAATPSPSVIPSGTRSAGSRDSREAANREAIPTSPIDSRLLALDSSGERVLRDRLDELAEERAKLDRAVDIAKENSSTSTAAYEALCEIDDEEVAASRRLRNRASQAVVSVLLPVAFICAGIPMFTHGREINSLSFTAFGIGLVVVAVFFAVAAFFALFRPAETGGLESRRTDAQWVMLQDRKKLDASLAERADFERRVAEFFDSAGLTAAEGSIRQARSLLDEARDLRTRRAEDAQRASSLELRARAVSEELSSLQNVRDRIAHDSEPLLVPQLRSANCVERRPWGERLNGAIREKSAQREALIEASDDMSRRIGELTRELEFARSNREFDQAKFEFQQLRVRLREAKHELISLLLAKRMLERSIATWEAQGQPEVHAQAGRLLATITDGRWVRVDTSPTGSLVAIDADGVARDPRHLSLGTCQQLYLALRIALLITAEGVGRDVPVLADDILVNFDAERRRGAARALAELAQRRQVIVFTCHEDTAAALRAAAKDAVQIDL